MDEEVGTGNDSSKGLNLHSSTCYPHGISEGKTTATFGPYKSGASVRNSYLPQRWAVSVSMETCGSPENRMNGLCRGMVKARMLAARKTDSLISLTKCLNKMAAIKAHIVEMCWSSLRIGRYEYA